MIELVEGKGVGAGKSYFAIDRLMVHWMRGGTAFVSSSIEVKWDECKKFAVEEAGLVLEDSQYRTIEEDWLTRLHEVTAAGSPDLPVQIHVDEAQGAFNARDFADKTKRPFFNWLCQSRHDDNDVIIYTQAGPNVDKQIRRLLTYWWVVRNTEFFIVGGISLARLLQLFCLGLWNGRCFVRTQFDGDGKNQMGRTWHRANPRLFKCYESKSMRLKHRRLAESVARLKLQKVKRPRGSVMLKYALPLLLLVGILGACQAVRGFGRVGKVAKRVTIVKATSGNGLTVVKAREYVDGETVHVAARAYCRGYMDTLELGPLVEGAPSSLGYVQSVRKGVARVKLRNGGVVQVLPDLPVPIGAAASPSPGQTHSPTPAPSPTISYRPGGAVT